MKIAPQVAIIGRPNVGKSTLLNSLAQKRCSIVDKIPGTTRDRISAFVNLNDTTVEFIDTGGLTDVKEDKILSEVHRQIEIALESSDIILWVLDGRCGVLPIEKQIADMLRKLNKPVIVAVNKLDKPHLDNLISEFYSIGFKDIIGVSALNKRNLDTLREMVFEKIKCVPSNRIVPFLKIAIVGKRNTGKSTFVNTLLQEERMIVSEIPGTTRDSVDLLFKYKDKYFSIIDTPGLRKKGRYESAVEVFSRMRVEETVKRADVILFFVDCKEKISRVDKQIAEKITESYKPTIIIVSKWDIAKEKVDPVEYDKYFDRVLVRLSFAPIVFVSSFERLNITETIDLSVELFEQASQKIKTSDLNRILKKIYERHQPPAVGGRMPKIYYGTQTKTNPPTISLFVNKKELFSEDYLRYFENRLRLETPFRDVPIKIELREK